MSRKSANGNDFSAIIEDYNKKQYLKDNNPTNKSAGLSNQFKEAGDGRSKLPRLRPQHVKGK